MTTAHRPTWHPAIGRENQGGYVYVAPRQQVAVRDLGERELKYRQVGQNTQAELASRDLKGQLEAREKEHDEEVRRQKMQQGLIAYSKDEGEAVAVDPASAAAVTVYDDDDDSDGGSSSGEGDSEDEGNSSDDEEAELLRELAKIKAEREQKKAREEEAEAAVLAADPTASALGPKKSFAVKRRWDDDVVFKNQARDEPKPKKRFINDTIRSDFHRNFLHKYLK